MFRDEFEEGPVYSMDTILAIIAIPFDTLCTLYPTTYQLNDTLLVMSETYFSVPVFVNDTCEDVIRWSEDIGVTELSNYVKSSFLLRNEVPLGRAVREICSPDYVGTSTGEYFKRYLRGLADVTEIAALCRMMNVHLPNKEDFYTLVEKLGAIAGLVYERGYPLERRKNAIQEAAILVCTSTELNRMILFEYSGIDCLITCVALSSTTGMYQDSKMRETVLRSIVDVIGLDRHIFRYRVSEEYYIALSILEEYKNIEQELARAFYDEIKFSLMLLEVVYDLNIMKLLRDNPELFGEDVVEVAHLLLD